VPRDSTPISRRSRFSRRSIADRQSMTPTAPAYGCRRRHRLSTAGGSAPQPVRAGHVDRWGAGVRYRTEGGFRTANMFPRKKCPVRPGPDRACSSLRGYTSVREGRPGVLRCVVKDHAAQCGPVVHRSPSVPVFVVPVSRNSGEPRHRAPSRFPSPSGTVMTPPPSWYQGYPASTTRATDSDTTTGLSEPSRSTTWLMVTWMPPPTCSADWMVARIRMREPTGTGAGKRTLL